MNTSNPLLPKGSLLEQQSKGRRRIKIYVYCGIAVHVLLFGGLLMLGCGKDTDTTKTTKTETAGGLPPVDAPISNPPPVEPIPATSGPTNPAPLPPAPGSYAAGTSAPPVTPFVRPDQPVLPTGNPGLPTTAPVTGAATEYKVAKGDSYYTIHKKFGVSIKALEAANPTAPANKLKPGMTLQIPAPTAAAPTAAPVGGAGTAPVTAAADGGDTYTVKSGDNLTKIATSHHVDLKALRAANGLKTDRLKVGQKLKLPAAKHSTATAAIPAPIETPASVPAPVPPPLGSPAPAGTGAAR